MMSEDLLYIQTHSSAFNDICSAKCRAYLRNSDMINCCNRNVTF